MNEDEPNISDKYVNLKDIDFDVSILDQFLVKKYLDDLGKRYVNNYEKKAEKDELALIVGRFQPPHPGHLFQILAALQVANHVVIGIGSANAEINNPDIDDPIAVKKDIDNPFPAEDREFILDYLLGKIGKLRGENLLERVSFIPLNDVHKGKIWHEDDLWFNNTLLEIGKLGKGRLNVMVANDGWVKNIFQNRGMRTLSVEFLKNPSGDKYEGSKIRNEMRAKGTLGPRGRHKILK